MSKDITTEYTKVKNKEDGRRGYGAWKHEKRIYNLSKRLRDVLAEKERKKIIWKQK